MSKTINTTSNSIAQAIVNNTLNINRTAKTPKLNLVKEAGTTFLTMENEKVGVIGGSKKEQEANLRCIQLMVDNAEHCENGHELGQQCALLTRVMANFEGISLEDVITLSKKNYVLFNTKAYNEMGHEVVDINTKYPELKDINMPNDARRAIVIAELQSIVGTDTADEDETQTNQEININAEQKLGIIDMIKALRELGMTASWFNVNGERQMMPICCNGESDLKAFTKVVKDSIDNERNWLDVMMTSCRYAENGINADEICTINDIEVLLDYTKKEAWDESGSQKLADLSDIEYNLPKEAIKVMLLERAKTYIEEQMIDDEEDDEEYDDEDCGCRVVDCYSDDEGFFIGVRM